MALVRGALVALMLGTLVAPGRARADSDEKVKAKALLASGGAKYQANDFAGAIADFQAAYQTLPNPKILFNLGQAYRGNGQPELAADAFGHFLEEASQDVNLDAKRISDARAALKALEPEVIRVQVEVSPAGATLVLDGARTVRPNFYMRRDSNIARPHTLVSTASGYASRSRDFTLAEVLALNQQSQKLQLQLQPAAVASAQPPPAVLVPVPTPAPQPNLAPQPTAPSASTPEPRPDLVARPPEPSRVPAYVAFGVGGAAAATAMVFGFMALGEKGGLSCGSSAQPCAGPDAVKAQDAHGKAQIADVLWGAAAVAAGTGVVLYIVAPGGGDGSGGELGITGHF